MELKTIIERLTPEDISFFLERSGWLSQENDKLLWFKKTVEGQSVELMVPKSSSSIDFKSRVEDILTTIAALQNTSPFLIGQQIYSFDRDFINLRVVDINVFRGTIPLTLAERVIRSLNKLLKFAAAQVEKSRNYYLRPPEKAIKYLDGLRFAHTFEGSFGFTVESPLALPTIGMPEIGIESPFERKVVERVYDGFEILEKATNVNSSDFIVENIMNGFNANMCESIIEISEEIKAIDIIYNFAWSPIIPVTEQDKLSKAFTLTPGDYRILDDAARQLKNETDELDTTIVGSVTILKAPPGFLTHDDYLRLVTISGKTDTGIPVNINTSLETPDYQLACDAHRDGKAVIIKGHIKRGVNRRWEITEYSKFGIVSE